MTVDPRQRGTGGIVARELGGKDGFAFFEHEHSYNCRLKKFEDHVLAEVATQEWEKYNRHSGYNQYVKAFIRRYKNMWARVNDDNS